MNWRLPLGMIAVLAGSFAHADDWPRWQGPAGNGSSPETGLLTTWPTNGPKVLWQAVGGEGYSSIVIAKGRAMTLVNQGDKEYLLALDAVKGTELWKTEIAPAYKNSYGNGPRSTPTIEGDRVWIHSPSGILACLDAAKGDIVWKKQLLEEFKAQKIDYGLSASPVIDGDLVICLPGKDGGVVALKKDTGELAWRAGMESSGYSTPKVVTVGGKKQIVCFLAPGLVALSPDQGKELWRVDWATEYDCNICTPLLVGDDKLFITSGEGVGCALFKLKAEGTPEVVWESKGPKSVMINFWANSVLHDGYLYGLAGEFNKPIDFRCVDPKNGKIVWSEKKFGKGAITLADGHLFVTTKEGDLVLIQPTPERYLEKGRVKLLGDNRTVPTIANKRLYLRDKQKILCLDLGADK